MQKNHLYYLKSDLIFNQFQILDSTLFNLNENIAEPDMQSTQISDNMETFHLEETDAETITETQSENPSTTDMSLGFSDNISGMFKI
jgi:hypothetical protein